eukprot:Nk52_evm22s228 gene=Nk52_evmTU22s228
MFVKDHQEPFQSLGALSSLILQISSSVSFFGGAILPFLKQKLIFMYPDPHDLHDLVTNYPAMIHEEEGGNYGRSPVVTRGASNTMNTVSNPIHTSNLMTAKDGTTNFLADFTISTSALGKENANANPNADLFMSSLMKYRVVELKKCMLDAARVLRVAGGTLDVTASTKYGGAYNFLREDIPFDGSSFESTMEPEKEYELEIAHTFYEFGSFKLGFKQGVLCFLLVNGVYERDDNSPYTCRDSQPPKKMYFLKIMTNPNNNSEIFKEIVAGRVTSHLLDLFKHMCEQQMAYLDGMDPNAYRTIRELRVSSGYDRPFLFGGILRGTYFPAFEQRSV